MAQELGLHTKYGKATTSRECHDIERPIDISNIDTMSRAHPNRKHEAIQQIRNASYTKHHHPQPPSSKKPRFDARNPSTLAADDAREAGEEEDYRDVDRLLEIDEIGRGGQQPKRSAVNLDGYDTDSSNENFELRATAKAEANAAKNLPKSHEEEVNDMFADLEEAVEQKGGGDDDDDDGEDLSREGKTKKKKDVRFLDVSEIEGQVPHSKSGGRVSADTTLGNDRMMTDQGESGSSSSESGDEERARIGSDVDEEVGAGGKKKHAPRLDAFNMRAEDEEGKFDGEGNFVRKAADRDAVHDRWLEGLSKKDMKKAREAQAKRENDRRHRDKEDDSILSSDILSTLIRNLERGETILEALQRLGKGLEKKKRVPTWQKNKRKDTEKEKAEQESEANQKDAKRREKIAAVTEAADRLLTRGQTEVYDLEREMLVRQYERVTGDEWVDVAAPDSGPDEDTATSRQWQYRWSDKRDGGQLYGPYDGLTMSAWGDAGYFGEDVEFRRVGDAGWSRSVDFV